MPAESGQPPPELVGGGLRIGHVEGALPAPSIVSSTPVTNKTMNRAPINGALLTNLTRAQAHTVPSCAPRILRLPKLTLNGTVHSVSTELHELRILFSLGARF